MSRVSRRTRDSETCSSGRDIQIFRLNIYLRVWGGGGDRSLPTCYSKRRGSWKIHLRFKDREEEGGSWLIAGRGDSRKKLCVYIYRGSLLISELENLFKKFLTKGIFDTIQFKGNSSTKESFFRVLSKIFLSSPFIFGWKGKNGDCLFLSLLKRDLKRARGINRWRGMEKSRGGRARAARVRNARVSSIATDDKEQSMGGAFTRGGGGRSTRWPPRFPARGHRTIIFPLPSAEILRFFQV